MPHCEDQITGGGSDVQGQIPGGGSDGKARSLWEGLMARPGPCGRV